MKTTVVLRKYNAVTGATTWRIARPNKPTLGRTDLPGDPQEDWDVGETPQNFHRYLEVMVKKIGFSVVSGDHRTAAIMSANL